MTSRSDSAPPRLSWLRLFSTALALILMVYLLQQHWAEITDAITRIDPARFALAMGLMLVSRLAVSGRWHVLLRAANVPITWRQSIRITLAGLFAGNFLPSTVGGDVARLAGTLQAGYDSAVSAASLLVDRLVGLAGMALAMPLGVQQLLASGLLQASASSPASSLAAAGGMGGKLLGWIRSVLSRVMEAIRLWLKHPWALLASLFFTLVHMACIFLAMYILLADLHDPLPFWTIAGLWSLVYVITLVPFTINALGLQEISITFAFSQLGGVSEPHSLMFAVLVRLLFMLASLPGALFLSDVLPGISKAQPLLKKFGR
ncbi:MAG TPA: lysylphosphatidylglycerol synthase transmembrane domain-containing protein [Anaerolineales bacterium]|nr:lysylphosphatidylglycerol synthase transmembrane domain-containing protein [Anaerolineales bacterium]HRQ92650.1 lysylphosphatidylglycerol synthase transmembrane domain-containing protein [Anaerolineales bacterium]